MRRWSLAVFALVCVASSFSPSRVGAQNTERVSLTQLNSELDSVLAYGRITVSHDVMKVYAVSGGWSEFPLEKLQEVSWVECRDAVRQTNVSCLRVVGRMTAYSASGSTAEDEHNTEQTVRFRDGLSEGAARMVVNELAKAVHGAKGQQRPVAQTNQSQPKTPQPQAQLAPETLASPGAMNKQLSEALAVGMRVRVTQDAVQIFAKDGSWEQFRMTSMAPEPYMTCKDGVALCLKFSGMMRKFDSRGAQIADEQHAERLAPLRKSVGAHNAEAIADAMVLMLADARRKDAAESAAAARVDDATPVDRLKEMALKGNAEAQVELGTRSMEGRGGMPEDKAEGFAWYKRAAELGHREAAAEVGIDYALGRGTSADPAQAYLWTLKAAQQSLALGMRDEYAQHTMHNVGWMLMHGQGVPKNEAEGAQWYQRAVEAGSPSGMAGLGRAYLNGQGVPKDPARALELLQRAAEMVPEHRGELTSDIQRAQIESAPALPSMPEDLRKRIVEYGERSSRESHMKQMAACLSDDIAAHKISPCYYIAMTAQGLVSLDPLSNAGKNWLLKHNYLDMAKKFVHDAPLRGCAFGETNSCREVGDQAYASGNMADAARFWEPERCSDALCKEKLEKLVMERSLAQGDVNAAFLIALEDAKVSYGAYKNAGGKEDKAISSAANRLLTTQAPDKAAMVAAVRANVREQREQEYERDRQRREEEKARRHETLMAVLGAVNDGLAQANSNLQAQNQAMLDNMAAQRAQIAQRDAEAAMRHNAEVMRSIGMSQSSTNASSTGGSSRTIAPASVSAPSYTSGTAASAQTQVRSAAVTSAAVGSRVCPPSGWIMVQTGDVSVGHQCTPGQMVDSSQLSADGRNPRSSGSSGSSSNGSGSSGSNSVGAGGSCVLLNNFVHVIKTFPSTGQCRNAVSVQLRNDSTNTSMGCAVRFHKGGVWTNQTGYSMSPRETSYAITTCNTDSQEIEYACYQSSARMADGRMCTSAVNW